MKASIALQVLPLAQGIDRIAVIDQVIAHLQAQEVTMVVTPFETTMRVNTKTADNSESSSSNSSSNSSSSNKN